MEVLRRIHDHGIWHGDLHPGNLLVTPHNDVFVLDFAGCDLSADARALYHELRFFEEMYEDPAVRPVLHLYYSAAPTLRSYCY